MTDRYVRLESTGPVTYMEWKDGEFVEKTRANYRFITSETTVLEDDVWYVVEGALKLNRGLTVGYPEKGDIDDVHIILTDGSRLEVQGADHYAGILVKGGGQNDKLYIYGQAEGTGTLVARGGSYAAGIGGNDDDDGRSGDEDCGTVMIHGGKIEAYGGSGAAGIGGGYGDGDGDGGDVTIYGGDVTAVGDGFGAGIGGGYAGESGTLKLYGGNVTAIGGASAVGVGSGYSGDTPSKSDLTTERAFRIWAGASVEGAARQSEYDQTMRYVKFEEAEPLTLRFLSSDEELVLSNYYFFTEQTRELSGMGGFCVVEGEFDLHHGLVVGSGGPMLILADGSSLRVHGEYGKAGIRVEDGDVIFIFGQVEGSGRLYAEGGEGAAGIGGDSGMDGGDVYIEGGVIEAIGGIDAAGIGGGKGGEGNGKVNIALRADVTAIGGGTDGRAFGRGSGEEDEPMEVVLQDGAKVYASDTDESAAQFYTSFQPTAHYERIISGIQYMAWDDSKKRLVERFCSEYEVFTPDMTELKSGKWYLVTGTNVLDHGLLIGSSAYIILEDGCRLELHGEKSGQPGIDVERGLVDDRLHIYGQKDGTGQLLAWGGEECAGIGGRAESLFGSSCGEIYIHGGHIEAYGGSNGAAGIGGGARETPIYPLAPFLDTRHSNFFLGGDGPKKLNIYGGEIFAYAGDIDGYENYFAAAGIGGGGRYSNDFAGGNGGTINIFGGLVVAEGGPGIGPGRSGPNLEAAAKRIYDSGDSSMELWIGGGRVIGMIEYAQNENGVLKKDSVKVDSEFYSIWSDETHLMESVQHRVRATISCEDVGTRWNPWKIGTTPQAGKEGVTFGDIWAYLEDGQLTCVGQGTISAQAFAAIGSARSSVKSLVISNGIVAIENNAFAGIGTVAEPVELHLPSNWSVDDVPQFNTSWRGGFFFSKPFNPTFHVRPDGELFSRRNVA